MKPMLAKTLGPKYERYPCYVQPKLNGVRALYQNGVFQSRDEKIWKYPVVEHLTKQLDTIHDLFGDVILDGELYKHGWKLQRINGAIAVNRKEPCDDTHFIEYHVFDVVHPTEHFSRRWFNLYHSLGDADLPHIVPVPTAMVINKADMEMHFHLYTKMGYEGIMLRPDGIYESDKRSNFLWKHKQWEDDEFICVGVTEGEGKAEIGIGALILGTRMNDPSNGKPTFKVGTGFSDEDRLYFKLNPPIGKPVRVRYLCLTNDGIPFNPSFIAVMT